jgi:hypothetical protein
MPRSILATPVPMSRHGYTAKRQALVFVSIVVLGEVE